VVVNADKAGNHAKPAAQAGSGDGPTKDDAEELQQEIARTREHLGDTVQQLAAKAHVKAIARERATDLSERVKSKTEQARIQTTARAHDVRSQLAGKTTAARHRAESVSHERLAQVREQVAAVGTPAWEATPEQVREVVARGVAEARQRRVSLAFAVGGLVLGLIIIRWWRGK